MKKYYFKGIVEMETTAFNSKEDAEYFFRRNNKNIKQITEQKETDVCNMCSGKGWTWMLKDDIPLSMLPAGNFGRIPELEEKKPCPMCFLRSVRKPAPLGAE